MTKYLLTPTLLNSYAYYKSSQDESEQKAFDDLMRLIRKEPYEQTEAQKNGIAFEKLIQEACINPISANRFLEQWKGVLLTDINNDRFLKDREEAWKRVDLIDKFVKLVKGGLWQQAVKKDITINSQDFLLYGKCDVIKEDTIYDIKTTKSYDIGKYNGSTQHLIYMYCSGLPKFSYLICENEKEFYREDYSNSPDVEDKIKEHVNDFLSFLDTCQEVKKEYFNKWICKY